MGDILQAAAIAREPRSVDDAQTDLGQCQVRACKVQNGDIAMTERSAFGKWLLEELTDRRWSMREFARRCDVSESTISRVVSGKRNPSSELCRRMAKVLHLPPERIFREAGLLPRTDEDSPALKEALYLFRQLPEGERRRILLIMRTLLEEQEQLNVASG